ncbi:hypothetical protein EIP91_000037 [Steccherinum ochraceum]|uniref:GDP/GTP exchange factor Sec2 N-terminal domain-containing protein n=1 Tax=Steccherinum ochraceum TaxID=92696 RepID=A0A4R0RXV0_9APHY|nr:hypothetical protein EIP91_000037 [Steccherinum ochraceum]
MSAHGHTTDDEMHELNLEADYLDQKSPKRVNGRHTREQSDPDAQAMVIESLKSQCQDLFSQVTQLNSKLVKSYDRVSDLEDELHVTSANLRSSTLKVSNLELERTQHLSALSTGLLVEKDHVTTELTRLMEKATEEAARRGQAESARAEIEKDLDDLSAGLFDQANRMVAEARWGRAQSERKAEETEKALRGAEEVVGMLQAQMQSLQTEKELSERRVVEMRAVMGKGKWVSRPQPHHSQSRYLSCHLPYHEYIQFIAHLRSLRPSSPQVPAVTTLLPLPFLARLVSEDSDPTVRLDLAPSLNWLTRRSVLSAIHSGQLTVEPMSTQTLLEELAPPTIPATPHHTHVNCALCGSLILEPAQASSGVRSSYPQSPSRNGTWSFALKNSLQTIATAANPGTVAHHATSDAPLEPPTQVYIFRLAATSSSGLPVSLPISPQQTGAQNRPTIYPLCTSGWCLMRLRTTCTLWAFVRTNIVEKVWEEEPLPPTVSAEPHRPSLMGSLGHSGAPPSSTESPATPKKSRMGIGAIWGTMQRGLSGSKGDESPKSATGKPEEQPVPEKNESPKPLPARRLPPPPPRHPPLSAPIPSSTTPTTATHDATERPATPVKLPSGPPPPLPARNRTRESRPSSLVVSKPPVVPESEPFVEATEVEHTSESAAAEGEKPMLISPPVQLTRSESHDSFTTPTEELSPANLTRPSSPTTIPLPHSSPSTPLAAEFGHSPDSSDKKDVDSAEQSATTERDPSPPPVAPGSEPETRPEQPPRPSGPSNVPPPLPRRAAGRARSSVVPPAATEPVVEHPASLPEEPKPASQSPKPTEVDDKSEASPEKTPDDSPPAPALPTREQTPEVSAEVTPVSEGVDSDRLDDVELSTPPDRFADDETIGDLKKHADVNGDDDDTSLTMDRPSSVEGDFSQEERASDDEETPLPELPEEEEEEDEYQGTYVGDASWEERTWKELVRLREDMYYARIGCSR